MCVLGHPHYSNKHTIQLAAQKRGLDSELPDKVQGTGSLSGQDPVWGVPGIHLQGGEASSWGTETLQALVKPQSRL